MIRPCILDDVPWILTQSRLAHVPLVEEYDEPAVEIWVRACIGSERMITMRGEAVIGVGSMFAFPWAPSTQVCMLSHFFRPPGKGAHEAFHVIQAIDTESERQGCRKFYIDSMFADLSPFARRLGGRPLNTMWVVEHGR